MGAFLAFLEGLQWVLNIVNVLCAGAALVLILNLRSRLRSTRRDLILANRRSRHWKHYAHVLEIKAFEHPMSTLSAEKTRGLRDGFRARYITDFQGWGDENGKRAEVQS